MDLVNTFFSFMIIPSGGSRISQGVPPIYYLTTFFLPKTASKWNNLCRKEGEIGRQWWWWGIQGWGEGCPPTDQNFLDFIQFLGKSGKFVCWRPILLQFTKVAVSRMVIRWLFCHRITFRPFRLRLRWKLRHFENTKVALYTFEVCKERLHILINLSWYWL